MELYEERKLGGFLLQLGSTHNGITFKPSLGRSSENIGLQGSYDKHCPFALREVNKWHIYFGGPG